MFMKASINCYPFLPLIVISFFSFSHLYLGHSPLSIPLYIFFPLLLTCRHVPLLPFLSPDPSFFFLTEAGFDQCLKLWMTTIIYLVITQDSNIPPKSALSTNSLPTYEISNGDTITRVLPATNLLEMIQICMRLGLDWL